MEVPVADETQDLAEVRLEKLRQIEALGIDPWGQRFDDTTPIGDDPQAARRAVRRRQARPEGPRRRPRRPLPHRREALFLEIWDQTGRVQVMVGVNKVSETEWKVAQLLDLGDLIGVDGEFGKTKTGEPTIQADDADVPDQVAGAAPEGRASA